MRRQPIRVRLDGRGVIDIVDPGYDSLPLLQAVDSDYDVPSAALPGFTRPRIYVAQRYGIKIPARLLAALPDPLLTAGDDTLLWMVHRATLNRLRECQCVTRWAVAVSLLDLKIELARRMLSRCNLCAHRCGVDRTRGELGVCGLGTEATVAEHFVHIAEESFINPSLILSLAGCGLRCRFCQQGALLDPAQVHGDTLDAELWKQLDTTGARSLSFVGGNPDESLYAILQFLKATPEDWNLPIVWNCHGYETPETIDLLDGIVDAWLPDFKYGNEACGRRLSGAPGYPATAKAAVAAMLEQGVPVIVRILVLPGHFECCHAPVLKFLDSVKRDNLFVSVRGQYRPDWEVTTLDGGLGRRAMPGEVEAMRTQARKLRLQLAD
jgi:putative pyruvate formate lyase activating enzyme